LFLYTQTALANDGAQLLGKWVEHLSNGGKTIVDFTETSISFTPIDASGTTVRPTNNSEVTFRKLGTGALDASISIDFKDKNGKPSGGILAVVKSEDEVVLDFPSVGTHLLRRVK
jgi:hypothetical protein